MEYRQNSSKFQYENLETEAKSILPNTHFCSLYWLCTDNQQYEAEKAKINVRADQRKNIANIENEHGESEESDVKRNI